MSASFALITKLKLRIPGYVSGESTILILIRRVSTHAKEQSKQPVIPGAHIGKGQCLLPMSLYMDFDNSMDITTHLNPSGWQFRRPATPRIATTCRLRQYSCAA